MILYGLRLLVALLTFAVGVAAAWLLSSEAPKRAECRSAVSREVIATTAPQQQAPRTECFLNTRRLVAGGILNGKAISKPVPVYPPAAGRTRVSGTVAVQIVVDESGRVESAEAVSGPELLRDSAVEAAFKARFSPTLLSGQPVKVSGYITYNFVLP